LELILWTKFAFGDKEKWPDFCKNQTLVLNDLDLSNHGALQEEMQRYETVSWDILAFFPVYKRPFLIALEIGGQYYTVVSCTQEHLINNLTFC